MKAFVPYEKLSKKKKRELDSARRGNWGSVNPVSRRVESAKVYNKKSTGSERVISIPVLFIWSDFR